MKKDLSVSLLTWRGLSLSIYTAYAVSLKIAKQFEGAWALCLRTIYISVYHITEVALLRGVRCMDFIFTHNYASAYAVSLKIAKQFEVAWTYAYALSNHSID